MSKKDAYYFSHDAGARNDFRIKAICKKFSLVSYAWYFIILEIMREQSNYGIPESLINLITDDLKVEEHELLNFIDFCCEIGLFYKENNCLFSSSFINRMDKMDNLREKRRLAGSKGGSIARANEKQSHSNAQATLKQTLSIKGNESKLNKVNKSKSLTEPPAERVESLSNAYQPFLSLWNDCAKKNGLPELLKLSKSRIDKLKKRVSEDADFITHFKICLNKISESDFLRGRAGSKWKVSFDWLVTNEKNYLKVLEGNYTTGGSGNKNVDVMKGWLEKKGVAV